MYEFQGEYEFRDRDWHIEEYWNVSLSDSIRYNEKIQVDWLKGEKFPIPPEFQEETVELSCPDL